MQRDTVKTAAAAVKSEAAMGALAAGQMSLTEAAAAAEFEDDPDAVAALVTAAERSMFDHTLARLRQQRELDKRYAEAAEPYREQGYTILEDRPAWRDITRVGLEYLHTPGGAEATTEAIAEPSQWAVHLSEDWGYFDGETGEAVDDEHIDFDTQHSPNLEPEEGLRHFCTVEECTVIAPEWFCLDYQAAGLELGGYLKDAVSQGQSQPSTAVDGDDREAAAQREAEEAEGTRRERRKVRELNKLGEAAAVVRREFVTTLLARKTPPKGAARFVARCLSRDSYLLTQNKGEETARELLGGDSSVVKLADELADNGDNRAQVLTLALVLGALEARTPKDAWRDGRAGLTWHASYWSYSVGAETYVRFLVDECGYTPAAVEQVIAGQRRRGLRRTPDRNREGVNPTGWGQGLGSVPNLAGSDSGASRPGPATS